MAMNSMKPTIGVRRRWRRHLASPLSLHFPLAGPALGPHTPIGKLVDENVACVIAFVPCDPPMTSARGHIDRIRGREGGGGRKEEERNRDGRVGDTRRLPMLFCYDSVSVTH